MDNGSKEVVLIDRRGFLLVPNNNRLDNNINGLLYDDKHLFDNEGLDEVEKSGYNVFEALVKLEQRVVILLQSG